MIQFNGMTKGFSHNENLILIPQNITIQLLKNIFLPITRLSKKSSLSLMNRLVTLPTTLLTTIRTDISDDHTKPPQRLTKLKRHLA